jgi:hypothetical protein
MATEFGIVSPRGVRYVAAELGWCRFVMTVSDPRGEVSCQDLPPHLQTSSVSR